MRCTGDDDIIASIAKTRLATYLRTCEDGGRCRRGVETEISLKIVLDYFFLIGDEFRHNLKYKL